MTSTVSQNEYPDFVTSNDNWNWDRESLTKAHGLKASLSSFQTIAVFIITKNVLDMVQVLTTKLQKRDQDVFEAYKMIDEVVECVKCEYQSFHISG